MLTPDPGIDQSADVGANVSLYRQMRTVADVEIGAMFCWMPTNELRRAAADELIRKLRLDDRLRTIGEPVLVGSAALGVMVARDIDLTVIVPDLDRRTSELIARLGADLSLCPGVHRVLLRDDTGRWNTDPAYPDGRYIGIGYEDWTLDIWFVDEPARQPDLCHLRTLLPRLTEANRAVIVEIKQSLVELPPPGGRVPSFRVYEAVLDHGVANRAEFDRWQSS